MEKCCKSGINLRKAIAMKGVGKTPGLKKGVKSTAPKVTPLGTRTGKYWKSNPGYY